MPEPILKVDNVEVAFEERPIISKVSFEVQRGDVLAILGPNGAGKSVLFRALMGLIPYAGKISWQPNLRISYAPQKFQIERDLPLNVKEFLNFKQKNYEKINKALQDVGLGDEHHIEKHILGQPMGWLSGGELQRVLIAWSLLDNPDVLLFDEPTTGIDIGGEETIYNLIHNLKTERQLTVLLISHDLNIVYKFANSVVCLNKEMVCYGAPHNVLDPAALKNLYGGDVEFYKHEHKDHESRMK